MVFVEMGISGSRQSVLLALTDTHHGFCVGAARYAREHGWHLVTDMIYTASLPYGWKGDGILSFIGNRRLLEKAFRRELGRGINQEPGCTRLRAVVQRLKSSEDSVTDIAVKTGYTRQIHLFRTFCKHFGISPRQYREQARLAIAEEQAGIVRNLD